MVFVDEARIQVKAGAGGDGSAAFHSEPYKPKGGPDGGDGGDGGSVILRADNSVGTLLDLRDHPHVKATPGTHGLNKRRHGSRGEDRIVVVPPGTVVHDGSGLLLADLANEGDEFVAARGGRGGKGNVHFATATRQAPTFRQRGEPGETRTLQLELRLLADVGLVGFPNAGKSTLISHISAAKPKIADYPFTTLVPNLGVVSAAGRSFVVADIPGIVPGAHEGKGLGDRFLRHIRRAAVLLFMVDLAAVDRHPADDVDVLLDELRAFDPELAERPRLVAATKVDIAAERLDDVRGAAERLFPISSLTGEGIAELISELGRLVEEARAAAPPAIGYIRHVIREQPLSVTRTPSGSWQVAGGRAERAVGTVDLEDPEGLEWLQRRLVSLGVERMLLKAGARPGDEVEIAGVAFDFEPEGAAGEPGDDADD